MKGERRYSLPAARSCRRAWDDQSLSHRGGRVGEACKSQSGAQCTASQRCRRKSKGVGANSHVSL